MDELESTASLRWWVKRLRAWLACGLLLLPGISPFSVELCIAQLTPTPDASPKVRLSSFSKFDEMTAKDFASALIEAGSEKQIQAMLAAKPELVTRELWNAFDTLAGRASLYYQFDQTASIYRVMHVVATHTGDPEGIAKALIRHADYSKDEQVRFKDYEKSFQIAEATGNKAVMGEAMCAMGYSFLRREDTASGFEHLLRGLELIQQSGEKHLAAKTLTDVGALYYLRGDYDMASDYFQRSVVLSEEVGNKDLLAMARFHLGAVHRMRGEYAQALEMYLKSQKLLEGFGDTGALSSVLRHTGTTYYLQRDYQLALRYLEHALRIDKTLKDSSGIAYSLLYRGAIYIAQNRYGEARDDLEKSLKLFEALPLMDGAARTLGVLGSLHHALGEYDTAIECLEKSLALREHLGAKDGIASTLLNIAIVHDAKNEHGQALGFSEQAAAMARRIGSRQTLWGACTITGKSHRALNQLEQARAAFDEAIVIIETMRAQMTGGEEELELFFEDKVYPYQQVIKTLFDDHKGDEAFVYAERAKARVLLDVLSNGRADVTGTMSENERVSERMLKRGFTSLSVQMRSERMRPPADAARLAGLQKQLDKARLDYADFQTNLYAAHPELKLRRGEVQPVTRNELLDLLPDAQTALIEYVVTDDRTFLFVFNRVGATTSTNVEAGRVGLQVYAIDIRRQDLTARVEHLRHQLGQRNILFSSDARALYELLLKPAQEQLEGITRVVVVPDGALWELPFQALQTASGRYVVEDFAVSYAPSLTVLREMSRERSNKSQRPLPPQTLLAFGDPSPDAATTPRTRTTRQGETPAPLPEAQKLVRSLASLYGANRSRVYTGADAREKRFKAEAGRYRVVHLATHGILDNANPMYSHVVLTPEVDNKNNAREAEDGLLEAWELMSMNLHADLVVLSACETARGGVRPGEGMIGLAWGLFVAGSPTAVVSQWKIDSASTTELMLAFHRNLSQHEQPALQRKQPPAPLTKAGALRAASLQLLRSERYAHPFYWAGFVLIGDGF